MLQQRRQHQVRLGKGTDSHSKTHLLPKYSFSGDFGSLNFENNGKSKILIRAKKKETMKYQNFQREDLAPIFRLGTRYPVSPLSMPMILGDVE